MPTVVQATATPSVAPATYTVRRGEVVEALRLKGRVAAALDQDLLAAVAGYVRDLQVQRDDPVTSGQLLAEIDIGDLPKELEQARAELQSLEAASSGEQRQLTIDQAQLQLQSAEDSLARLQAPPSPEKLGAAREKVDQARIALESTRNAMSAAKTNAKIAVERAANALRDAQDAYSKLIWPESGSVSGEEKEQAERVLADAELALQSAQVDYDLAVKAERSAIDLGEREVRLAQQEYDQLLAPPDAFALRAAEREVETARINLQMAQAASEDPSRGAQIEQLRATIAELEGEAAKAKVVAPFDGVVAEIGVQIGDKVAEYDPLMNVIDPTRLIIVVADIAAEDLARIAADQPVDISLARYPGETIAGRVERLPSDQVSPTSMVRADTLLRIAFEPGGRALDIGDVAEATLTFRNEPDALWLPPAALFELDRRTFVVLEDGEQRRQVDVTVGIRTPERIQILSGLHEGDVVVGPADFQ